MEISASNNVINPFDVLIVAGGSGLRLGNDLPKQYQKLGQKTILRHTIEAYLQCETLQSLRVVINPDHKKLYEESIAGLDLPPPISGGNERILSVNNGLKEFSNLKKENIILIHDAARPFITKDDILKVVNAVKENRAATLACPVSDTIRRGNGDYIDRQDLWCIQTPQGFEYGLIMEAHDKAAVNKNYTDDTAMVEDIGVKVALVPGPRNNIKITTPEDMILAQTLIKDRSMTQTNDNIMETRIGTGFDVHAFDKDQSGPVRICGVDVDHFCGLAGHSDADVGLHALTDALLGAVAEGDIGQHFPSSDPQWAGKDSSIFLEHAMKLLDAKQAHVINLDLTLVGEEPKVGKYRDQMRERIAEICGIDPARVSVKATTTDKLGYTGRAEGLAAQALATVMIPTTPGIAA